MDVVGEESGGSGAREEMVGRGGAVRRDPRSIAPAWEKAEQGRRVSDTLDRLLAESSYDKRFRPGYR